MQLSKKIHHGLISTLTQENVKDLTMNVLLLPTRMFKLAPIIIIKYTL